MVGSISCKRVKGSMVLLSANVATGATRGNPGAIQKLAHRVTLWYFVLGAPVKDDVWWEARVLVTFGDVEWCRVGDVLC